MKRAHSQASQSAADAALQYRVLAMGRVQAALGEHIITARGVFQGLSEAEKRRIAAGFAARLARLAPGAARARLLAYLGQIHGDLAARAGRGFGHKGAVPVPARRAGQPAKIAPSRKNIQFSEFVTRS